MIAGLTFIQGAGMMLPFRSMLAQELTKLGVIWIWIALFALVGIWAEIAAYAGTTRHRQWAMFACSLTWAVMFVASARLQLPIAMGFAVLLSGYCVWQIWLLR